MADDHNAHEVDRKQQRREDRRDRAEWHNHTTETEDIPRDRMFEERPLRPRKIGSRPAGSF